ncbi:MAG TPA: hypothetical protein ENF70_07600 [Deltaproteobacteria bacterium]|nr:hypothetical protein [Deltaproteobacteria bacterium]
MKDLYFPVPVFFDSDVMIAGSASANGASFALLQMAEFGLIKGHIPIQVLEECRRNLAKKLPGAITPFEKIVERCVKDVPILASALEAKACFLVTFNMKDYWPDNSIQLEVLTPGELLSRIRLAVSFDLL